MHNIGNKYNRVFNKIKNFPALEAAKLARQSTQIIPADKSIIIYQKETSKRKLSVKSAQFKEQKRQHRKDIKHASN